MVILSLPKDRCLWRCNRETNPADTQINLSIERLILKKLLGFLLLTFSGNFQESPQFGISIF